MPRHITDFQLLRHDPRFLEWKYAIVGSELVPGGQPDGTRIIGVDRLTAVTLEARVALEACRAA